MGPNATGESVLSRAVRILGTLGVDRPGLTITEISRLAGLHVATTSRLVAELVHLGILARHHDGTVHVGVKMWELAQRSSPIQSLRRAAMPFLEDLHAVVRHHVQLSVLDDNEILFLERLSAPSSVITYTHVAGRLPLHASSSGLVMLAHGDTEMQESILSGPLRSYTEHTITDPRQLREVLDGIRRHGFVVCHGHIDVEATAVAVPLLGHDATVVAGLSVIVPNDGAAYDMVPILRTAAHGITRALTAVG